MKERATQLCGSWPCRGSLQNSNLLAIVVKRGGACTLSSTTCPPYAPAPGAGYMSVTELADIISSTIAVIRSCFNYKSVILCPPSSLDGLLVRTKRHNLEPTFHLTVFLIKL